MNSQGLFGSHSESLAYADVNTFFMATKYPWSTQMCVIPLSISTICHIWARTHPMLAARVATSTDFRNRLTGPPNSNRIRLTERFASPYGALCFHVFTDSDSPPGPSRLSLQVVSLLVSNQTSFMQIKWRSKIITCSVLMHKNKSLTWCYSPVSSRIKQGKESCYSNLHNQR